MRQTLAFLAKAFASGALIMTAFVALHVWNRTARFASRVGSIPIVEDVSALIAVVLFGTALVLWL